MVNYIGVLSIENEVEPLDMSIWPTLLVRFYRNMATYSNHHRTATWMSASNIVIYDYGVMGGFEHTPFAIKDSHNP